MQRLRPTNDFIFKKLFGEEGDEPILIAFLNAVLKKTHEPIKEIIINDDTELTPELLDDKMGRIDVRAKT
ncbi:MAG: PD-(D/E)XK nuclease family transposase, partial [Cellulosilyticaceae bacterium]